MVHIRIGHNSVGTRRAVTLEGRLAKAGVPPGCIGYEYRALPQAVFLGDIGGHWLVAFGTCGSSGRFCVDIATDGVVQIPTVVGPAVNPVNVNLDAFGQCVAAVIARFPFYGVNEESGRYEEVARELRRILSEIDESTLSHNGFWETFTGDVTIGDYATELIF